MIEWPYLIVTLRRLGFGDTFIEWFKLSYTDPKSFILTNGDKSSPFTLQCGVRQGDPLSPLLFDMALEPLALGIRGHPDMKGIKLGDIETRVTIICLADPAVSNPILLDYYKFLWEDFWLYHKLAKVRIYALSGSVRVVKDCFSYLGLKLTINPKHLFRFNFIEA